MLVGIDWAARYLSPQQGAGAVAASEPLGATSKDSGGCAAAYLDLTSMAGASWEDR